MAQATPRTQERYPPGFKPLRKRDDQRTRRHLKTLRRRLEHLDSRILEVTAKMFERTGKEAVADRRFLDREKGEVAALKWALGVLEQWIAEDPLFEYDWYGCDFTDQVSYDEITGLHGTLAHYRGDAVEIVGARLVDPTDGRRTIRLILRPLTDDERRGVDRRRPLRHVPYPGGHAFGWELAQNFSQTTSGQDGKETDEPV